MTMQTFVVLFLGVSLGYKIGLASIGLYLFEGILGLPVFSNSPEKGIGLVYFTGPTMGYLIGFLTAGYLASKVNSKDNFFILSCDHIYHIQCLAETHFEDVYKYPIIDTEYFSSRKCNICYKQLQLDEVMYLHGKYLKNTKDHIESHQNSIENFEYQLKKMKEELRVCYEYKHKLEQQREKSKQIVSILSTMIYN